MRARQQNTTLQRIAFGAIGLIAVGAIAVSAADAFTGPANSGGVGSGAIGTDSRNNVAIGTSTTDILTKLSVYASSTNSVSYALQVYNSQNSSLFYVRNDGAVSIPGSLTAGSFTATVASANVSAGTFAGNTGGGNFTFPAALGLYTAPGTSFDINKTGSGGSRLYVDVSTVNPNLTLYGPTNGYYPNLNFYSNGAATGYVQGYGGLLLGTQAGQAISFYPGGVSHGAWTTTGLGVDVTPSYKLDVAGDINTTGALRVSGAAGSAGNVLQSTGTGLQWVATSTLGLGGATTMSATNISAGAFGANTGGGNYSFPANVDIASGSRYTIGSTNVLSRSSSVIGIGNGAGNIAGTGTGNIAIGDFAFQQQGNTNNYNVIIGLSAATNAAVTGADGNVGIGAFSLWPLTSGDNNVGVGYHALDVISSGGSNTALGYYAGHSISSASNNTTIGLNAGYGMTSGANNVVLGAWPSVFSQITSGSNNIAIGYDVAVPTATASNQLSIGNLIYGTGINGTGATTSTGNIGIGITAPAYKLSVAGTIQSTVGGYRFPDGSTQTTAAASTMAANNISSGAFGGNTGGGNYSFPSALTVGGNLNVGTPAYSEPGITISHGNGTAKSLAFLNTNGAIENGFVLTHQAFANDGGYLLWTNLESFVGTSATFLTYEGYGSPKTSGDGQSTAVLILGGAISGGNGNIIVRVNNALTFPDGSQQTTAYLGGTQTMSAANVSAGSFGGNTGGGNYIFPAKLGIGGTSPSYYLDTGAGTYQTGTVRFGGRLILGHEGSNYDQIGYNAKPGASNGAWTYDGSDYASFLKFGSGGFQFYTAPSGTAGASMTATQVVTIDSAGNISTIGDGPGFKVAQGYGSLTKSGTNIILNSQGGLSIQAAYGVDVQSPMRLSADYGAYIDFNGSGSYAARLEHIGGYDSGFLLQNASSRVLIKEAASATATPFEIQTSGGSPVFSVAANGALTVGGGTGKINVGTVDPIYQIGGEKFATYVPGIIGVKEEVAGDLEIPCSDGRCTQTIDFANQDHGSDLWLFGKVTDIKKHLPQASILLTPAFDGRVSYQKGDGALTIIATPFDKVDSVEVSYRFTAPRFDADSWSNTTKDEAAGFIIP